MTKMTNLGIKGDAALGLISMNLIIFDTKADKSIP